MSINKSPGNSQAEELDQVFDVSRRRFFQLAGGIAGAGLILSACTKRTVGSDIYLGEGDVALLNLAYILQQLEATFYTQAVATPYYGLTASEAQLLSDMRDQEIAHREFFKTLLGTNAIPNIVTNFSMVTFAERGSTLGQGFILEDLVISAFNGMVHLFQNSDYALAVSRIVTVEARHSAYFRDLYSLNSFADTTALDANGLDAAVSPAVALTKAKTYIQSTFDSTKLPN